MRTLRVSLVGTVIFALLGGMGAVTLAQSDADAQEAAESTSLSFTMPYANSANSGPVELLE